MSTFNVCFFPDFSQDKACTTIVDNNNKIIEYPDMISSPVATNMSMIITRHVLGDLQCIQCC